MENQNESTEQKEVVIKRYGNRKLYNTEDSCYITLSDVYNAVKNGRVVRVIDNKTKLDITTKTLFASLVDNESDLDKLSSEDIITLIKRGISLK